MKKYLLYVFLGIVIFAPIIFDSLFPCLCTPPRPEYKVVNFLRTKMSMLNRELKSEDFYMRKRDNVNFEEEYSFEDRKDSFELRMRKTYSIDEDCTLFLFGELMKLQREKFSFLDDKKNYKIVKNLPPADKDFTHNFLDALIIYLDEKCSIAFLKLNGNNLIEVENSYIKGEALFSYLGLDENGKIIDKTLEKSFLERINSYREKGENEKN